MNIIFSGDWIKVDSQWRQVIEIGPNDTVQIWAGDDCFSGWLSANDAKIEKVVSDSEMQASIKIL